MKVAYIDCASGVSGDMTLAALIDAGASVATVQSAIDSLGLPSCRIVTSEVKKRGFRATQVDVEHEPEHAHRHLHHITAMIERSTLTPRAAALAVDIFTRLGTAEAKVHGTTIQKVHFHEVGAVDSIADIVGVAVALDELGIERVVSSPVPTGKGFVMIAHGRCAIPAPATAELLRDVPLASLDVEGELTTPTGAAIVATLAERFGPVPAMTVRAIGYGAGHKDFEQANILRILVGDAADDTRDVTSDAIVVLEANIDDLDGESIGYASEQLREAGALDVSLTPMQMKKGRPAVLLAVQARPEDADRLEALMFMHTSTFGVRRHVATRRVLPRERVEVTTTWGAIGGMLARLPDGTPRFVPEYEDCRRVAASQTITIGAVRAAALAAFQDGRRA